MFSRAEESDVTAHVEWASGTPSDGSGRCVFVTTNPQAPGMRATSCDDQLKSICEFESEQELNKTTNVFAERFLFSA